MFGSEQEGAWDTRPNGALSRVEHMNKTCKFMNRKHTVHKGYSFIRNANFNVPRFSSVRCDKHSIRRFFGPYRLWSKHPCDLPKVLRNTTVTLFADDTALYCSSQSARDLQTMLNQDLDRLAQWLYEHKLTLNVSKSKFMLIGGPGKLNALEEFTLTIKEKELDRVNSYKYLGVIINENLSWTVFFFFFVFLC